MPLQRFHPVLVSLLLPLSVPAALAGDPPSAVAPTAGDAAQVATFRFRINDESGALQPVRIFFRTPDGERPDIFPNAAADPLALAVRRNTVYALAGEAAITVPPGRYTVWATRGLEWSIDSVTVDLRPGEVTEWTTSLRREVDTTGWVSGDFHLHTLTHSGHGDSNMHERLISLIGEGVEFAVATDHNHNVDYGPTLVELDASERVTAVVGNEVSTPIGHFNAFPLDPARPVPPADSRDANALFSLIRAEPNAFGITPVIQLNHPRWAGIDYFNQTGLDPLTGRSDDPNYSGDFDSIEVFNENEGWGYFDPVDATLETEAQTHSVLLDWFNLLNRGRRYAAVGNSDSHTVESELAGYPRNFVPSATDDPGRIDPAAVADAIRRQHVFTTIGPFVEFRVNDAPMGSTVQATPLPDGDRGVSLSVRVQAASWIDCDRVKIIINGDVIDTIEVPPTRTPVRLETEYQLPIEHDAWVSLCVEGDDPLEPIVHTQNRPILPLAVTNPVWIDADADGSWTPPSERVRAAYAASDPAALAKVVSARPTHERALLAQSISAADVAAAPLVLKLLDDPDRRVRQSAMYAAARLADTRLLPALQASFEAATDEEARISAVRAMIDCGDPHPRRLVLELASHGVRGPQLAAFSDVLIGCSAPHWRIVGPFPADLRAFKEHDFGPESAVGEDHYPTAAGPVRWRAIAADADGFVDLQQAYDDVVEDAVIYAHGRLTSPGPRQALFAFGSDDAGMLMVNGLPVVTDTGDHTARPFAHLVSVRLEQGPNEILIKVRNGSGDCGFYLQVFDDALAFEAP